MPKNFNLHKKNSFHEKSCVQCIIYVIQADFTVIGCRRDFVHAFPMPGVTGIFRYKILNFEGQIDEMLDLPEYPKFPGRASIIESVQNNLNLLDGSNLDQYGNYEDKDQDAKMSQFVSHLILHTLRKAKDSKLFNGKLLIPSHLSDHVARDVLIMAREEPCGVRGCSLEIVYDDGDLCRRFGRVSVDPDTVTTFEITVILGRDSPKWFMSKMQSVLRNSSEQTVLKSCYKLVKTKLYRRNSSLSIKEGS